MTKRQMVSECTRLAPDFSLRFERPQNTATVLASCTIDGFPFAWARVVGPLGRAATESLVLEAALARLKQKTA